MTEAPDEPHSSETAYNGTALRHAPAIIHAHKSKGAKWGRSGHWLVAPLFGMNVAYQRLDIAESRAAETERLRALLREAGEALRMLADVANDTAWSVNTSTMDAHIERARAVVALVLPYAT